VGRDQLIFPAAGNNFDGEASFPNAGRLQQLDEHPAGNDLPRFDHEKDASLSGF